MNWYLKQARTNDKKGVSSYKLLYVEFQRFCLELLGIFITNIYLKNHLSLSYSKLRAKLRKLKNFTLCVSSFQMSLFLCNPEPKLG